MGSPRWSSGAGRARKEDAVDPAAGLLLRKRVGDQVRAGDVLAELHAATEARLDAGEAPLRGAVRMGRPAHRAGRWSWSASRSRLRRMRILYGVVGEGMGHAIRSRVVLEHLVKQHDVQIVVSGRAHDYLAKRFENVHKIWGFTIIYEDNRCRTWQTLLQNLKGAVTRLAAEHQEVLRDRRRASSPTW